ncbi:putative PHD type zinc finger protein with BAH domain-containing protein [Ceratobasidium sp. 428]|nr:putative PHD type zinc finger protein with BAH domain-containing protein [Ceratobasidium sp. 428]
MTGTEYSAVPHEIREVLQSRYEFVVAERDVIGDLTDTLRLCETCEKWAPSHDSVRCDTCKCYFHMACVNPPLVAKPAKGYGWTCGACSRQHDEQVGQTNGRNATPAKARSSRTMSKSRSLAGINSAPSLRDINSEDRYFKMWPFRYFGQYTVAEDTLDPDDLIFPKAATRVGPRFQAVVGPWTPQDPPGSPQPSQTPDGIPERGGDDTVEIMSNISNMESEQMDGFEAYHRQLWSQPTMQRGVDFLEESARRYSLNYLGVTNRCTSTTRPRKWQSRDTRFWDKVWTSEEIDQFEKGIKQHGPEVRAIKEGIRTRSVYEVVRYYGHWKNDRLGEENRQSRTNAALAGRNGSLKRSRSPSSDDEGSVYGFGGDVPRQVCGACRTKESNVWWKAPRGLPSEVMCDQCGISWRKYGDIRSGRIEEPKKSNGAEKRENTPQPPVKRTKVSASRGPSPPPVVRPQHVCCCCKKTGPPGRVVQCSQCAVTVHAATYGVTDEEAATETWLCELCQNQKSQESSLNPDCLLCPRTPNDKLQSKQNALASTVLRLSKPTEGRGWVHTLCSVFVPETSFTDASRLRLVEGISSVSDARWASECSLCRQEGGAVVSCAAGCGAQFHVSCAWLAGHAFGFEVRPSKNTRRDPATVIDFRGETGVMKALIRCKAHPQAPRPSFEICSLNTNGEVGLMVRLDAIAHLLPVRPAALLSNLQAGLGVTFVWFAAQSQAA